MKKGVFVGWILALSLGVGSAVGAAGDAEKSETDEVELAREILINGDSFSEIYPAVWFDPKRGTIHKLVERSEKPPVEGASIWIEPSDPEFAFGPGIEGMAMVVAGFGGEVFERLPELEGMERKAKLRRDMLAENKKPVIVIESEKDGILAVVMIEDVDKDGSKIRLRWRRVGRE